MSLKSRLAIRLPMAIVTFGTLLFLPAGSFRFWQAWVYIGIMFLPGLLVFAYFYKRDPQVLERRSLLKEKVPEQRRIMGAIYVAWLVALLFPGFDHRYGWSRLPLWLTVLSEVVVLSGYLTTFWVVKKNRFAARTIQVERGQEVISNGPYRVVRHPMYSGAMLLLLFTPIALGSLAALPLVALLALVIAARIRDEEAFLNANLYGYTEYRRRVRYRLVPFIW